MQDLATHLRDYMHKHDLTQAELAKRAKISQPSVCRALEGKAVRRGGAREKLFIYTSFKPPKADAEARLIEAFREVWDKSDKQADAFVNMIRIIGTLLRRE